MKKPGSVKRPTMYLASMDIKTAFDVARPKHVPFQSHLEQMLKDLIEEAENDILHRIWQACGGQVRMTPRRRRTIQLTPRQDVTDSLCTMNRQGKTYEGLEERMQSSNKAWWKDAKNYRCKDVPWRVKCRMMVEQVHSVFFLGCENWSWTQRAFDGIKGWETKAMSRLFRLKKDKNETWSDYYTRTCRIASKIWVEMELLFVCSDRQKYVELWDGSVMKSQML